jgi:transcriptional regulator with XRE-family HTH domain
MSLGEKIKKLRELKNYTQQYMANQLEISQSGYGKIERNETDISITKLEKIAGILETDIISVLTFEEKHIFNSTSVQKIVSKETTCNEACAELVDKIIQQYITEITYLKSIIDTLINKDK